MREPGQRSLIGGAEIAKDTRQQRRQERVLLHECEHGGHRVTSPGSALSDGVEQGEPTSGALAQATDNGLWEAHRGDLEVKEFRYLLLGRAQIVGRQVINGGIELELGERNRDRTPGGDEAHGRPSSQDVACKPAGLELIELVDIVGKQQDAARTKR